MKKLLLFSALAVQLAAAGTQLYAQGVASSPLEAKLALENSLEKRLRLVLAEALGTEDIIVIISADMQEQVQGRKAAVEIMPGVPEKEKVGELSLSSTLTMVKNLSANNILDKSVSDEDTKLAVKLAAGLLGLPPERQDLVSVEKMNFRKSRALSFSDLLAPPNVWSLAWLALVLLLVLAVVFLFLAPLSRTARSFVEAFNAKNTATSEASRERAAEVPDKAPAEAAKELQSAASADGRKPPFWFLNAANAPSLAFIMQSRPAEDLTIVLSYVTGDVAAKLSEALYPRSVEALAALPAVRLLPETRVRALETDIQAALDYVVGGEDKALAILNGLDEAMQEKTLSAFSRIDPVLSRKLNSAVVKLSDLRDLEPAQAQALARRLPIRVLAAALKTSTYSEIFVDKLTEGMQERFRQELELTRAGVPGAYKAEKARVVEALRQMISEGFITRGGAHGASAAPASAAAGHKLPGYFAAPGDAEKPGAPAAPPAPHTEVPAAPPPAPAAAVPPPPAVPKPEKPPVPAKS